MATLQLPPPLLSQEQTWADQSDLNTLFAPKATACSEPIYAANNNYGFSRCLKHFAGLPASEPIYGVVPHGASDYRGPEGTLVAPVQELSPSIPCILASSEDCAQAFRNSGKQQVVTIGLASLYALLCIQQHEPPPAREGSLFMRIHGTAACRLEADDAALIAQLKRLPQSYHPIRVCAHWNDWHLGHYKLYNEAGFEVVGAGHLRDDLFIWRHWHLLNSHQRLITSGGGTHVWHAVQLGLPVELVQAPYRYDLAPSFQHSIWVDQALQNLMQAHFSTPLAAPNAQQKQLAEGFLGSRHLRTPEALKLILQQAQAIHQRTAAAR